MKEFLSQFIVLAASLSLLGFFILCTNEKLLSLLKWRLKRIIFPRSNTTPQHPDQAPPAVSKEPDFPADWLTSPKLFALEKRAIFSTEPHYTFPSATLPHPGSYTTLTLSTYPLLLIRSKDHRIRAFHNVCRHRAYPVARKPAGKTLVLGCRYHGWSYDSFGKLVKAPQFERKEKDGGEDGGVRGFEKGVNGLWEVGCWEDAVGRVWVCLDGRRENREGNRSFDGLRNTNGGWKEGLVRVASWEVESSCNWKLLVDELPLSCLAPSDFLSFFEQIWDERPATYERLNLMTATYRLSRDVHLMASLLPHSVTKTAIRFDLYARKVDFVKPNTISQIMAETKNAVSVLSSRRSIEQIPGLISKVQKEILHKTKAHIKLEQLHGREINPAAQQTSASCSNRAEELCNELDTMAESGLSESLDW